jgi:uncharacterized protein (DUF433 family)
MGWEERIESNPEILVGKPVIKGTRIAVEFVLELMADGWTEADLVGDYPGVTQADIRACFEYASERLKSERVSPLKT